MKEIKSKYVVWNRGEHITLYLEDEKFSFRPLFEEKWEDVTITFQSDDCIVMEGDMWDFGCIFTDEYPENLEDEVHPDYIEKTRFRKKDIVRSGWYRKLHNKHRKVILNKYIIEGLEKRYG